MHALATTGDLATWRPGDLATWRPGELGATLAIELAIELGVETLEGALRGLYTHTTRVAQYIIHNKNVESLMHGVTRRPP